MAVDLGKSGGNPDRHRHRLLRSHAGSDSDPRGLSPPAEAQGERRSTSAITTVEDVGLALGQALRQPGNKARGIGRFSFVLAMDEVRAVIDSRPRPAEA